MTLSNVNTYGGATTIDSAPVLTIAPSNLATLTLSGSIGNSSALSVGYYGTLAFTGSSNNTRVADSAPVTLAGARVSVSGLAAATAFNETFGTVAASGVDTFSMTAQTSGAATTNALSFANLTLNNSATLFFRGGWQQLGVTAANGVGQATFANGATALANVSDSAANMPGTGTDLGIVPNVAGSTSATGTSPNAFVTYDSTAGIELVPVTNTAYVVQAPSGFVASGTGATADQNVNLSGTGNASTGTAVGVNASVAVNALATTNTQVLTGTGTVTVASGAVLAGGTLTLNGPTLNFNAATGYIHVGNTFIIAGNSQITGSGGVVFSGVPTSLGNTAVQLGNSANGNPFTGGLTLNGVAASFNSDNVLGATNGAVTLDGSSLNYSATSPTAINVGRAFTIGAAGGSVSAIGGTTLALSGNITGSGSFGVIVSAASTGVVALTGSNSYAGPTYVSQQTLNVGSDRNLGTGPVLMYSGGTLQFDAATTLAHAVTFLGTNQFIDTNGYDVTLAGSVSGHGVVAPPNGVNGPIGTGYILNKIGSGTLTLAAADPSLSLGIAVNASAGSTPSVLSIAGNGAVQQAVVIGVASGAEFRIDNTTTNLPDRINDSADFLVQAGSTVRFVGMPSAVSTETVGGMNLSSAGATNVAVDGTAATFTVGGLVSGVGSINKTGTGTLVLTAGRGPNSFSGGLGIAAGAVRPTSANALGFGAIYSSAVGSTAVSAGGSLDLGGQTLAEPVTLNGGSLVNSSATPATLTSGVKGTPLTAGGVGYAPTDTVVTSGGTGAWAQVVLGLTASSFNANSDNHSFAASNNLVTVIGGGGTGAKATATQNQDGTIAGITVTNPGSGYTSAPSFNVSDGSTLYNFTGNTTGFTIVGTVQTSAGTGYDVPGATSTVVNSTGGSSTGSGASLVTPAVSSLALSATSNVGGTGDLTVQPSVTGSGGLAKVGSDNVFLTGASGTYSGGTTVSAGTLRVNAVAATGSGPVTVNAGGTLGGRGTIANTAGPVTINVNGIITAGADATYTTGIGTLYTQAQTWNASGGSLTKVSADGTASDLLVMSSLTVNATNMSGSQFVVNVTSNGTPTLGANQVLVLAVDTDAGPDNAFNKSGVGPTTLSELTIGSVTGLQSATGAFALATQSDTTNNGGYDLVLEDTAATPEPASLLLLGATVLPLALGRRRRPRGGR